jgi:hypothetical protein|tara:strand:+ start:1728 stop:1835 length:108 start_codon:yes stop_codon:yes gene_type:complete
MRCRDVTGLGMYDEDACTELLFSGTLYDEFGAEEW